jgi:hypothetical protein
MKKRNQSLNKFERMLLESKFPTLRVLLEEEGKEEGAKEEGGGGEEASSLDDLFGGGGEEEKSGGEEGAKEEGGGTDDLFGGGGKEEGGGGEEGADQGAAEDPLAGGEEDAEKPKEDKAAAEEQKKKDIEKAVKQATNAYDEVTGDVILPVDIDLDDKLFGSNIIEGRFNRNTKRQFKRLQESISKYLFQNVKMRAVKNKKIMSLKNSFSMNESKLFKINHLINEANSVDDMINNKFWEDNASIDLIVNNAINLTKNFQNLIDIPALIMNSVAIKFGKQAAEEVGENKGATNEYKTKLEEFLDKYSQALTQLPDYEHYSVEKIRLQNPQPAPAAIGASNPGG